jgi:hypothetical protein
VDEKRFFMKNLFKMLGIIALVAVIGFTITACPTEPSGGRGLTINGLPSGTCTVNVFNSGTDVSTRQAYMSALTSSCQALGSSNSGNNFTLNVFSSGGGAWTGSGTFPVLLRITNRTTINAYYADIAFTNGEATVDYSSFKAVAESFDSIIAFKTWLSIQPDNTAATAYRVVLNINDLGGSSSTEGSVGAALLANSNKYVIIDFSRSSITSIGSGAFSNCDSLAGVIMGNNVASIDTDAFSGCNNLDNTVQGGILYNKAITKIIFVPKEISGAVSIPDSVTSIPEKAFSNCYSLTSIIIGNGVTSIGFQAFVNCINLTSVTIGNGVTSIGTDAFITCGRLVSVTIPGNVARVHTPLLSIAL